MYCPNCGLKMTETKKKYQYTESGLDNVILENTIVFVCTCGEEAAVIPNIAKIHQTIALELVKKKSPLIGSEIRFLRKELSLKAADFAKLLGVNKVTVSRWEKGKVQISSTNDKFVRLIFIKKMEEESGKLLSLKLGDVINISKKHQLDKNIIISINELSNAA